MVGLLSFRAVNRTHANGRLFERVEVARHGNIIHLAGDSAQKISILTAEKEALASRCGAEEVEVRQCNLLVLREKLAFGRL